MAVVKALSINLGFPIANLSDNFFPTRHRKSPVGQPMCCGTHHDDRFRFVEASRNHFTFSLRA